LREVKRLRQELKRREKALAQAAAMLIFSRTILALFGEAGDD
jgi:transposase